MNADERDEAPKTLHLERLRCRRTGRMLTVAEHAACPYCSGDEPDVRARGRYEDFCTYREGVDPLHFGFRPDSSRNLHG